MTAGESIGSALSPREFPPPKNPHSTSLRFFSPAIVSTLTDSNPIRSQDTPAGTGSMTISANSNSSSTSSNELVEEILSARGRDFEFEDESAHTSSSIEFEASELKLVMRILRTHFPGIKEEIIQRLCG